MTDPSTPTRHGDPAASPDPLERRLAALTDWRDGEPKLYAAALHAARQEAPGAASSSRAGVLTLLRRRSVLVPAAAAAFVMVAAAQLWIGSGARVSARRGVPVPEHATATVEESVKSYSDDGADKAAPASPAAQRVDSGPAASVADRMVIRKASIEIQSKDIRADFARVGLLVNTALGEFVEASSLTGEGAAAQGTLTLRVEAARLSDVLNSLRELGTVASERSNGDDVTDQVVDLDARLRNEKRIETELLGLVDSRKDSPLKEVLDLREQLSKVRERIEQLTGQRERIGKSVSLAAILVILRPDLEAHPVNHEQKNEESAWEYFTDRVGGAWHAGTRALADSAAGIVRALVGGLVWWALLAFAAIGATRWLREARRRDAREAAPVL